MAKQFLTNIDFATTGKVVNAQNGVNPQDYVTMAQLNGAIEGLSTKDDVTAASAGANVSLSAPGTTLDGITLAVGNRILLKDQTNQPDNGIYIYNGSSTALTRSYDASANADLLGATVTVDQGTANGGTTWRQTAVNITLGTTNILWTPFGVVSPPASTTTAGIIQIATQAQVNAGAITNMAVTPQTLAAYTGFTRKYAIAVGDASNTSYTVTHNLNSQDVTVEVYRNSTPWDKIECDVQHTSVNTCTLVFASAPAASAYRVVVVG